MASASPIFSALEGQNRMLGWAAAAMAFLLALALGSAMGLTRWAWGFEARYLESADLYLPAMAGEAPDETLRREARMRGFLENHASVLSSRFLPPDELSSLLTPWLGEDFEAGGLPLPRLVEMRLATGEAASMEDFLKSARNIWPGASLERGSVPRQRMERALALTQIIAAVIFAFSFFAMSALIFLGARLACVMHRETLEALVFLGAEEAFLSRHLRKLFVPLILRATLLGALAGGLALFAIDWLSDRAPSALLLLWAGGFTLKPLDYLALLAIPLFSALLTRRVLRRHMARALQRPF